MSESGSKGSHAFTSDPTLRYPLRVLPQGIELKLAASVIGTP